MLLNLTGKDSVQWMCQIKERQWAMFNYGYLFKILQLSHNDSCFPETKILSSIRTTKSRRRNPYLNSGPADAIFISSNPWQS